MSFYPKGLLIASVLVFVSGVILFSQREAPAEGPPAFVERSQNRQAEAEDPFPSVETLSAPWFRRPVAVAVVAPPKTVPVHVDTTSLAFLGSYTDKKSGVLTYFFKYRPSNQVVLLKAGQSEKGWTLNTADEHKFFLTGPGGSYEATR